jgi:DNA-directed RNA polymerase subunit beta
MSSEMRAIRSRLDFSKIPTSIQIPNLIEVQRRSYERFLQMDKLPQEREDNGLQSVFTSVFPISDFRNVSELEFVDFSIGNWECKCGYLKGLNHLRTACTSCGTWSSPTPFIRAMCFATSAEPTTRTPQTSAPSAATQSACS